MTPLISRLQSLRVGDVMSRNVVTVDACQSMADAAAVFKKHGISGAPVVDEQGRCVGILSATDFVGRASERSEPSDTLSACGHEVVREAPGGPWRVEDVLTDRVSAHMSPAVQSIDAETSIHAAAREMCSGHFHRLPVLDERGHPVGIVTSLDLVAAMAQAIDESHSA